MLEGNTFWITGATGRLGAETVQRLESLGANVQPLVLPGYPPVPKRVVWTARCAPLCIDSTHDLEALPAPDYLINYHWLVDRTRTYTAQLLFELECNLDRPSFLWQRILATPLKRFINISSIRIFSHLNQSPVTNETEPRPVSPYGTAKLTAEKYFDALFDAASIPVTHLRLGPVASYGEHPSHLLDQLYASAFKHQTIDIHPDHIIHLLYIDEVVDLIINAALSAKSERYIIAGTGRPIHTVATAFEEVCGKKITVRHVDSAPGTNDPILITDNQEFQTGWIRSTPLDALIRSIIVKHSNTCATNKLEANRHEYKT